MKRLLYRSLCSLLLAAPCMAAGQEAQKAVDMLTDLGFENVAWHESDNELVYVIENTAYKQNGKGIGLALQTLQENGLPEDKLCRVVVMDNNVPQMSLTYRQGDDAEWKAGYGIGTEWKKAVKKGVKNSSLFKVDVVIYPEISLKNLIINQIYQVLFNLSPTIEVSLWKGMKLAAQMVIPVYNDGYGDSAGKVHPGFIAARQSVRFPYNIWGNLTVGTFNNSRYGADLELKHVCLWDERFSVEARVGMTATYKWDGFECAYGTKNRFTWSIGGSFYWPRYNVQLTAKAEQYLLGEKGVRIDAIRHFKNASIGFYAMKAQMARANGGFRVQVLLPPYKYKRRGYIPRVNVSKNMGIAYNAGNERFYYQTYKSMPGDNMMQANVFNPYYIKSQLR